MNLPRLVPAFHIRAAIVAALTLPLFACAPSYPPVAEAARGDADLKMRIALRFPPGTPATRLRVMLAANSFRLIEDPVLRRYSAIEAPPNLPCFSTTRIDWTEDARGRIREIQTSRHACS